MEAAEKWDCDGRRKSAFHACLCVQLNVRRHLFSRDEDGIMNICIARAQDANLYVHKPIIHEYATI